MPLKIAHATIQIGEKTFFFDPSKPIDISLPLKKGSENPNCYFADDVVFKVIRTDTFTGSVAEGGSCNYTEITITPHGNGTHTECYGHISADPDATVNHYLKKFFSFAKLITLSPEQRPDGDRIITLEAFLNQIGEDILPEAVIIRTEPNEDAKRLRRYSGTNPPYLEAKICEFMAAKEIKHLLVDLPSIDREEDGGCLAAHKAFWQYPNHIRKQCTITELIFVPDEVFDGYYLLNLQIPSLEADAVPSKPVIYLLKDSPN